MAQVPRFRAASFGSQQKNDAAIVWKAIEEIISKESPEDPHAQIVDVTCDIDL
jgi:hypothetical protein